MNNEKHEDLRVVKTKQAIRSAFEEMICEMDFEEISIKELTMRAQINRKTFYLHYRDLDELLEELQDEIVDSFIKTSVDYSSLSDIRKMIRVFFESTSKQSYLHERLLCSGSYQIFSDRINDRINDRIMEHRKKTNRGAFDMDELSENIVFAYFGTNTTVLYRQWVADVKRQPIEDVIALATKLICSGMKAVMPA